MARLVINPGTPSQWEVQLRPGPNLLGRGFANDFKLDHPSVSTSHCEIVVQNDSVLIKDLGSTNGTFVNGTPVTEAALQPGQTIHLGGVELVFQSDPPPAATVPQTEFIPRSAMPPPLVPAMPVPSLTAESTPAELTASARLVRPTAPIRPANLVPAATVATPPPPLPKAVPAPAPAAAVATAVAIAGTGSASGPTYVSDKCKFHPKTPARFRCRTCHHAFCELCVATRSEGGVHRKFCRLCASECEPVKVIIQQAGPPPAFYKNVPGAFFYPLKGMGTVFLIFMALFFAAAPLAKGFRLYLQVIIGGYLFSYIQHIIQSTAIGEDKEPSMPEVSNFADDIVMPFFQLLGTVMFCFGPAIGLFIWRIAGEFPPAGIAMIPAAILGCIYLPMALLGVAMLDTINAVNPLIVIPSIVRVWKPYLITIAIIFAIAVIEWSSNEALKYFFGTKVTTKDMNAFIMGIVAAIAGKFVSIYLLSVNARTLGLLYLSKKQELGWFNR